METLIQASYFVVAVIFIVGLKQMSSPVTARRGILWAGDLKPRIVITKSRSLVHDVCPAYKKFNDFVNEP